MTRDDVREVIYEALAMYIDDMSMIGKVNLFKKSKNISEDPDLVITLKNGDIYRLIITPDVFRLSK